MISLSIRLRLKHNQPTNLLNIGFRLPQTSLDSDRGDKYNLNTAQLSDKDLIFKIDSQIDHRGNA